MHRSIIKRRMNNRLVTHVCHLRQIIKIQCRIRIFLKKRMKEAVDEERDIAAYIIQRNFEGL